MSLLTALSYVYVTQGIWQWGLNHGVENGSLLGTTQTRWQGGKLSPARLNAIDRWSDGERLGAPWRLRALLLDLYDRKDSAV